MHSASKQPLPWRPGPHQPRAPSGRGASCPAARATDKSSQVRQPLAPPRRGLTAMKMMAMRSVRLRPQVSPMLPKMRAPRGRTTKPTAYTAHHSCSMGSVGGAGENSCQNIDAPQRPAKQLGASPVQSDSRRSAQHKAPLACTGRYGWPPIACTACWSLSCNSPGSGQWGLSWGRIPAGAEGGGGPEVCPQPTRRAWRPGALLPRWRHCSAGQPLKDSAPS